MTRRPLGYGHFKTRAQAVEAGFTVDDTCYPHLAYKGPRFQPADYCSVYSDREAELIAALRSIVEASDRNRKRGFPALRHSLLTKARTALKACQ